MNETPDLLQVIAPGSPVILADEINATVTAVMIREGGRVSYQVVWWESRSRREEWINGLEVKPCDQARSLKLGF
jgi:hypothetical protein